MRFKQIVMGTLLLLLSLVVPVSAAANQINWTYLENTLLNLSSVVFPQFVTLIIAAVPIILIMVIVGFIISFIDKILAFIKI